jgi:glyoxylase-like metal-dependent hydrolase (beta-lactamase superfamily II)
MTNIFHLNCVKIIPPTNREIVVPGHCLLLEENDRLVLVDTGIGLKDIENPLERLGDENLNGSGIQLDEALTAFHQIKKLGFNPEQVTDCIISHCDVDHTGGLADFPQAKLHLGIEEYENFCREGETSPRYSPSHLSHHPPIKTYSETTNDWFGFEARKIELNSEIEAFLIPLFGHTHGHCGIALQHYNKWLFYVGDAYYLRIELTDETHWVNGLAEARAENNGLRKESLDKIKKLVKNHPEIEVFCYHDAEELSNSKPEF